MSIYTYPESKAIDQVVFKTTPNGSVRAYLHARPEVDVAQCASIIDSLKDAGLECIPFTLEGKPMLEVRGFQRESRLITLLGKNQMTEGKAEIAKPAEETGWKEKLKKRSLQASGAFYFAGDLGFIGYGWKGASPLDMTAGVLYALPTPVLLAYGRNDQSELQIKDFAKILAKEFKKKVETLPPDCALDSLTADHRKGLMKNVSDLLQRYPSEFMNFCYTGAGACIALAGAKHLKGLAKSGAPREALEGWLKHLKKTNPHATLEMASALAKKNSQWENWLNVGVGTTTISSGLFGALVNEKAPDPDEAKPQGLAEIWEWMRERPLSVAGTGFMVSTLLHAASTAVAMKGHDEKHKTAVPLRALFVISALLAEFMVAISSKGHGEGVVSDTSVDSSAIAIAADLIVKQPKAMQNALIEYLGRFIGRPDVLALGDEAAVAALRQEVEAQRNNPWAQPQVAQNGRRVIKPSSQPIPPGFHAGMA